ncbi:MAG: alkaline phosphatase [Alphaproteobacteria bacterium]|nr:alkaline phosphatase [Alphaproteobacteria bacterium]
MSFKSTLVLGTLLFASLAAKADNVILMIGDGMGPNHLKCAGIDKPLYIPTLPVKGWVITKSADSEITDSAASATAYSCGYKTNNKYLGKLPDGKNCLTIAEEAERKGFAVGIYSTDYSTGATPSAFYAHTQSRYDSKTIKSDKEKAGKKMDIAVPVKHISDEVKPRLKKLSHMPDKKGFFALFEGAKIDTKSHKNDLEGMKKELYDFDYAVMKAVNFAYSHPDTTVIVLADHETGGLTDSCSYTRKGHTGQNIQVHAYGQHANLFKGVQDNTDINKKIRTILFGSSKK